ncbi:sialin [Agrilus planipennis]|uniref:Sialin n=1 Tax=Agrilus planipennis TaxID=224129 RepID=A0A1W4WT87_AGRPL|nr:sialin [Agrilus planipennis]
MDLICDGFIIPQRWILGIMGFFAIMNAYMFRVVLSVAITAMVNPSNHNKTGITGEVCPDPGINYTAPRVTFLINDKYNWNEETQGIILSSFYWGYVVTHIPGAILSEYFGGKHSLGLGILSTAIFTLLTPFVVRSGNWPWLVVFRVLVGIGEGFTFPALTALLSSWVPSSERSRIATLSYSGVQIGTVLGNSLSGLFISSTNTWASPFYVFGGIGIIWFVIYSLICYSSPESHPFISDKEKAFLEKEIEKDSKKNKKIPWKHLLTSWPLWALILAQIGHDWGLFAMVTDLPKYMKDVLKFNVKQSGLWSSLPYIAMWIVSITSGWLCDWLINRGIIGINFARKFFSTLGALGPGIFLVMASYAGCDRLLAVAYFTIGMGTMGFYYCGIRVNALDLSPNYAGIVMAFVNGVGAVSGMITPYLIGALTTNQTISEWRIVFWLTLAVLLITDVTFIFFGSGKVQAWDSKIEKNVVKVDPTSKADFYNNCEEIQTKTEKL